MDVHDDSDSFEQPGHSPHTLEVLEQVIGNPQKFESAAFSKAMMRLEHALEQRGYHYEVEGGITMETVNHMHNIMVILSDKTLLHVIADTRGNYGYSELVKNVKKPTEQEMESIQICIDLNLA